MIDIRNISKHFDSQRRSRNVGQALGRPTDVLRGITLRIDAPGCVAIMGPSGSGKSTLLHLIAGLDRPNTGEILVAGKPIHQLDERALTLYRRRDVGIVFQKFNLISTMDAVTNVMLPGLLDGHVEKIAQDRALTLLAEFNLSGQLHQRPDTMSGGEQQRVAMARALYFEPTILLADEPTGNLDTESSERIWSMLHTMAHQRNMLIVMVTHEPAAAAHCDSAYILKDGCITDHFKIEEPHAHWVANRYQQSQCSTV